MPGKLIAALCCLLLLTSCDFNLVADPEALLQPPTLNKLQEQVVAALSTTVNISDIQYRYPQRGEYRSPFVFQDMDGDGLQEAIVFYAHNESPSNARAVLLREDAQGVWAPFEDLSMPNCGQVDFVQFAPLLAGSSSCLIVGWQSIGGQSRHAMESVLSVYSLMGEDFTTEVPRQPYIDYMVRDFDQNGLAEIVIIEWDSTPAMRISLLRSVGIHIDTTSSLPLCDQADSLLQMVGGTLWDSSSAVFLDERRIDTDLATEVVRVDSSGLTILSGGNPSTNGENVSPAWENYIYTVRDDDQLCLDYNGDGLVEIPYPTALPGTFDEGVEQPLRLTGLMNLTPEGFRIIRSAVINRAEGYLLFYPPAWEDWVAVQRDEEAAEWRFFLIDPETTEAKTELLRIRASDSSMPPEGANTIDLGVRGSRRMTAYIPLIPASAENVLAITEADLKGLFYLLP